MTVKDASAPEATASAATKVVAVWTGVGIGQTAWTWADLAAILAAIYSAILIGEWVWRRIAPYFGGLFHFSYLDPSGDNNWIIGLSIGPVLGIEYYIADRVSLLAQGTFQFGFSLTDPQAAIGLGSAISGGGQLGLVFYF